MPKYIGRLPKDDSPNKESTSDDEYEDESHNADLGSRIDIQDPLEVKDRSIFFSKEELPKTKMEIVQEKSTALKDQLDSTNQYQKLVNVSLQEKMGNIKKLLAQEKKFSEELNYFKDTSKTRNELEMVNSKYITQADTKSLINNLETEYQKLREQYDYELSKIDKTRNELDSKKQQIDNLKEEMHFIVKKEKKEEKIDDPLLTIRHELKKLGINEDSGKINEALRMLSKKINQTTH